MPFFKKISVIAFLEGIKIPVRSISLSSQVGSPTMISLNTPMTSKLWQLERGAHILVLATHDNWKTEYIMFDGYFTGVSQEKYAQGAANISLMGTSVPFALSRVKYFEISKATTREGSGIPREMTLTALQTSTPGIVSMASQTTTSLTSNELVKSFSTKGYAEALKDCIGTIVRPGKQEYPFMVRADKEHKVKDRFFSGTEENNAYWNKTEIFQKYCTSLVNSFGGLYSGHDVLSVVTAAAFKDYVELCPVGYSDAQPPTPTPVTAPTSASSGSAAVPKTVSRLNEPAPWLDIARQEEAKSISEVAGTGANPRIIEYQDSTDGKTTSDEVPWCAAFAGFCLSAAGVGSTRSKMARSYSSWGKACDPKPGAIAVFSRGAGLSTGHVAFVTEVLGNGRLMCLGGNQDKKVCQRSFPVSSLVACRWPSSTPSSNVNATTPGPSGSTDENNVITPTPPIRDVLIKPIIPFLPPPSCNIIFRTDLENIGMIIDYSSLPTRAYLPELPVLMDTGETMQLMGMGPSDQFPPNTDFNKKKDAPQSLDTDPTAQPIMAPKTLSPLATPTSGSSGSLTQGQQPPPGTSYVEPQGWSTTQKDMAKRVYLEAQRQGMSDPRMAVAVCMTEGSLSGSPHDNYNPPNGHSGGDTLDIGPMQVNTQHLGTRIGDVYIPDGAKHGRTPTDDSGRTWLRNIDNNILAGVAIIKDASAAAGRTGATGDELASKTYSAYNGGAGNVNRAPNATNQRCLSNYKLLCGLSPDTPSTLKADSNSPTDPNNPGSYYRTPDEDLLGLNLQTMNFPPQAHALLVKKGSDRSVLAAISDYVYYSNLYQGSVNTLALPYSPHIAVGFPIAIIDTSDADETMLGYVAAVNHMIVADGNATTQVSISHFRHHTSRCAKFPGSANPYVPLWFDQSVFSFDKLSKEFYAQYLGTEVFAVSDLASGDKSTVKSWVDGLKKEYPMILKASDTGKFQKRRFLTFEQWKTWHGVTGDFRGLEGIMFHGPQNPIMAGDLKVPTEWQTTIRSHVEELNRTGQSL